MKSVAIALTILVTCGAHAVAYAAKVPVPVNGCYLSAYDEGGQASYEALVGKEIAVGMFYVSWEDDFPAAICSAYDAEGTIPHVSWEPFGDANSNQKIIDGERDAYIRNWAQDAKAFNKPVFIRFGLEMNGDWYEWDGTHSGGSTTGAFGDPLKPDGPERFVAAHRHIHDIFEEEGVDNVSWIFAPNTESIPDVAWNAIANYYPGAEYVDWFGLDGYNWGATNDGEWQSFDEVFAGPYAEICALGDQPVMIAEFASAEIGGDKAAWVTDMFEKVKNSYPRMKAITWFNINKETDWRVNSSAATLQAFKTAISDPYFLASTETSVMRQPFRDGVSANFAGVRVLMRKGKLTIDVGMVAAFDVGVYSATGERLFMRKGCAGRWAIATGAFSQGLLIVRVQAAGMSIVRAVMVQ